MKRIFESDSDQPSFDSGRLKNRPARKRVSERRKNRFSESEDFSKRKKASRRILDEKRERRKSRFSEKTRRKSVVLSEDVSMSFDDGIEIIRAGSVVYFD